MVEMAHMEGIVVVILVVVVLVLVGESEQARLQNIDLVCYIV